jgi:DNA-binding transcriptional LysR family regulator
VCSLVKAGLGIAVIDQFTVADEELPGIKRLRIKEPTRFQTYVARKSGTTISPYAETFVRSLRTVMQKPRGRAAPP